MKIESISQSKRVRDLLMEAVAQLNRAGVPEPVVDAELMLSQILGCRRLELYLEPERELSEAQIGEFRDLVCRRARRVPLPYLLGTQEFLGLEFYVDERVLIPRPETEILVEEVLQLLPKGDGSLTLFTGTQTSPFLVADVGTGCGCIAVSLAVRSPHLHVYATDVSEDALQVAKINAFRHGVAERVHFLCGDLLSPLNETLEPHSLHAIVSNPPYVPSSVLEALQPEVRDYEPRTALNGGQDGLQVIRKLIYESPAYLRHEGFLALEIGMGQADSVIQLMERAGFARIWSRRAYGGIERVVVGVLSP